MRTSRAHSLVPLAALSAVLVTVAFTVACADSPDPADLVLRNGAVYTVVPTQPWAEAVAVADGRIVAVGSDDEVAPLIGADTRVVDLEGKMLLPGFGDSHVHPVDNRGCNVRDIVTLDAVIDAIRECASEGAADEWIRGGGWALFLFDQANPHKSVLDEIAPGRPIILTSQHGHSAWASSRALELAGVTKDTPDPENGRIERDPATGEPTGTLHESASRLVYEHVPEPSAEQRTDALRRGIQLANSLGITSFQDAGGGRESLQAYAALESRGELTVRAVTGLRINAEEGLENVARVVALRNEFGGERFRPTAVKIGGDGLIYNHTAALIEPYADRPDFRWHPNIAPEDLNPLVAALDAEGFQVHVHAVGDATVRYALDAFEHARAVNDERDSRHHIAHIDLAHPDDFPRFAELGAIANFQPIWAQRDEMVIDLIEPRIGLERTRWVYPVGAVVDAGGRIAFGSDWGVSSMNPLEGMQVAVTRRGLTAGPGEPFNAEEVVDLATAIAGYTIDVAYLNFRESEIGTLEVGKYADLVVLDRNLFDIPPEEIHQAKVLVTLLEGESVYEHESWR